MEVVANVELDALGDVINPVSLCAELGNAGCDADLREIWMKSKASGGGDEYRTFMVAQMLQERRPHVHIAHSTVQV